MRGAPDGPIPGADTSHPDVTGPHGSSRAPRTKTQTVDVVFAPLSTGALDTTLDVVSNDPVNPDEQVSLTGTGLVHPAGLTKRTRRWEGGGAGGLPSVRRAP